jgi:hypothetical protein
MIEMNKSITLILGGIFQTLIIDDKLLIVFMRDMYKLSSCSFIAKTPGEWRFSSAQSYSYPLAAPPPPPPPINYFQERCPWTFKTLQGIRYK